MGGQLRAAPGWVGGLFGPPPVMWHVFRDGAGWGSGGGWAVGEAGRGDTVFVEWGRQPF